MNELSTPSGAVWVAALTWVLKDSLGEELDVLSDPVEFLVGGDDLLPPIDQALITSAQTTSRAGIVGQTIQLYIEPEQGFGEFDESLIFLIPRTSLPQDFAQGVEIGMTLDASALQDLREAYPPLQEMLKDVAVDLLYSVTDVYPEHIVIDGNHPLAGIALDLKLKIHAVRDATLDEIGNGSAGVGFFQLSH